MKLQIGQAAPTISMETLMMEISFIKQELNELKKMMVISTQLIQQNFSIAQNPDRN